MTSSGSECSRSARKLGDLLARLSVNEEWDVVQVNAHDLANGLRNRDGGSEQTTLGRTLLPQTLTSLLKAALEGSRIPNATRIKAVYDLLRVGANLCMDHDENRGHLLEAGFPQTVLSLLEAFAETMPALPPITPHPLSLEHLEVIKVCIGVSLNSSLGYEPVQSRLISLEAAKTMLRVTAALYPPGSWISAPATSPALPLESWRVRSSMSEWCWKAISSLKDNTARQPLFGPESLPFLVAPLQIFVPPFSTPTGFFDKTTVQNALCVIDVEALEEVSEILESLSLDVEDVRLSLARGMTFPEEHGGRPCLAAMLDFVEYGNYPPYWATEDPQDTSLWRKSLDICKAAVIKAIIETAGDEKNIDVLWDIFESDTGFVSKMIKWLHAYQEMEPSDARDDMAICSTLSLANLARRENHSVALVKAPISIVPCLVAIMRPETDLKVKHGVVGLLKHLAVTPSVRPLLGEAGIIQCLVTSQVFGETADMAEMVQISAIGVAKHLCTGNVDNAVALVSTSKDNKQSLSGLDQILSLVRRSDSVPVKSEGTRVLVNVIKSLCSSTGNLQDPQRVSATKTIVTLSSATALAQLLGRSKKYIILLNEAIVALLLLVLHGGASDVLDALQAQLPPEVSTSMHSQSASSSSQTSPVASPPHALDMLVYILKNTDNRFPAEVRSNICALLTELGKKKGDIRGDRSLDVEVVKNATNEVLERTASSPESLALSAAARKALDAWA